MSKTPNTSIKGIALRRGITRSLRSQGFLIRNGVIHPPRDLSKDKIRELHSKAIEHKIEQAKASLHRREKRLLGCLASGDEVTPTKIFPRLVEVLPDSENELLFRYASLHWSIPVSSGYGRRIRFLVIDENNGKLMGLIGLGDPVFSLQPRDEWIGWTYLERKKRLRNVMDAFVLGAVPPYSFLLCGKLVAMLVASDNIRNVFRRKYGGARSLIKGERHDGRLALITTTSALGRSSIYNRLRIGQGRLFQSVGFTKGFGEFHFSNGLYGDIAKFADKHSEPTAKQEKWGTGFRNRREVIRKCLSVLGISSDWLYHGIEREVFVVPLAQNAKEFLQGKHARLMWNHLSEANIFEYFRDRWMLPRASWDGRFRSWSRDEWAIWSK